MRISISIYHKMDTKLNQFFPKTYKHFCDLDLEVISDIDDDKILLAI